jgi:hypothetical protein
VLIVSSELEQRRTLLSQTLQIDDLVVRRAGLPALPDNTDPFESQRADGGMMVFAFSALAEVVSAGPEGVLDRLGSKLMKSLAKELGTEVAPADAELLAAALDDGSDAGEGDQFIGDGLVTGTCFAWLCEIVRVESSWLTTTEYSLASQGSSRVCETVRLSVGGKGGAISSRRV